MHLRDIPALTFLLVSLSAPLASANLGSLDQAFELPASGVSSASIRHQTTTEVKGGQGFTVGIDGILTCVEVHVSLTVVANPLILEIRPLNELGVPGATVLASASIPPAGIPTTAAWVAFDLSTANLAVNTGEQYAIVLRCDELNIAGPQWYNWSGGNTANSDYAGGGAYVQVDTNPWSTTLVDRTFRTYVADAVPAEATTWSAVKRQVR